MGSDFDLAYDLDEALERCGRTIKDLEALRDPPVSGAPEDLTDKQLLLFLDACADVKAARACMKVYYDVRQTPELFNNRNPKSPETQQCLEAQEYFMLPPTPDGYDVIFHRLYKTEPSAYIIDNAMRTFFMAIDTCLYYRGPRPGIVFVFDMKGVSIGHMTRIKLGSIRRFCKYLQEGLPAKMQAIHVLNVIPLIDKILTLMKPFLKKEVLKLLQLHPPNMDLDEFCSKHLPRSCLPSDLGGDMKATTRDLQQDYINTMVALEGYWEAEQIQRTKATSKTNPLSEEPPVPVFKKLDID